ncbi:MAG: sensor histidine kinase [Kineosporiaceae bacterium]
MTSTDRAHVAPSPPVAAPVSRVRRRAAVASPAAVAVLLLLATATLDVLAPRTGPGALLAPGFGWPYALLGVVYTGAAVAVLWRTPRQGFGWALVAAGLFWSADGLAQGIVRAGVRADGVAPGINAPLWFLNRFGAFLPVTVAVLLFVFPDGRFLPGRWGVAGRLAVAGMLGSSLAGVLAPAAGRAAVQVPGVDLDWGALPLPAAVAPVLQPAAAALAMTGVVVAMAAVVVRYRRSRGAERETMRWLLWAVLVMALLLVVTALAGVGALGGLVVVTVAALPAVAMSIGIAAPRLVAVEDLVSATVVYGLLWVGLLVVDLLAVLGLAGLLGDALDQRETVLVALLLSAVVYAPLRQRLALAARRRVLGGRAEPFDVVAGLASRLETTDEGEGQLAAVAEAVAAAFGVGYVRVEVDHEAGRRMVATTGTAPERTRTLPISYRGEAVGRLVLPATGLRTRLARRDEQLLADLVRQAATAARTSRLAAQLQAGRERLVLAREEERRRIRRDLHDGLGPALGGAVFTLESARLLVDRDPARARTQIEATRDQLQDTIADVRRLVHDLRPPVLDDRGLVAALRAQAERLSDGGLPVTVAAADLPELPAAVEVAAYRIVAEALTNVVRHARASMASVDLHVEAGRLVVAVADDGVGVPAGAESGVGLLSLRERADELGGDVEVTCPPAGGTLVRARLPLHPAERSPT